MEREPSPSPHRSPDRVFDGGSLDCGSGLALLIRQQMLEVAPGGILEIRSTEPTVTTELPPWCRLAGHRFLQSDEVEPGRWRHLVERGEGELKGDSSYQTDRDSAKQFQWSLRARRPERGANTIYARNLSWASGPSLSFERRGESPTAIEQLLGSLLGDVLACFESRCDRAGIILDELEATATASLINPLAAIGLEEGDPAVERIKLVVYATSAAPISQLRTQWEESLQASPVHATLSRACHIETRLAFQ